MSAKRGLAWCMVVFSVVSTPLALLWFARAEPPFVTILCELGLFVPSVNALWQAEQMESDPTPDPDPQRRTP